MSHKLLAMAGATCLLMTGCVDKNYDLSDIDTTTQIKIDNLTLPLNIDAIKIDDVFKPDPDGDIKIVESNGQKYYALTQTGNFESQKIHIQEISIEAPDINPTNTHIDIPQIPAGKKTRAGQVVDIPIPITQDSETDFLYTTDNVDSAVYGLTEIYTNASAPLTLTISADVEGIEISDVGFTNLQFELPKGMEVSKDKIQEGTHYYPETGIWDVPSYESKDGKHLEISMTIDKLDTEEAGVTFNKANNTMTFEGKLGLTRGNIQLDLGTVSGDIPESVNLKVSYAFSDIHVGAISGDIDYTLTGIDIAPVSLGEIPDFLSGEGTNIRIADPQLYLNLNNPVGNDEVGFSTGFELVAIRNNSSIPDQTFKPDADGKYEGLIKVGFNHANGPYNFLLSPKNETGAAPNDFKENIEWIKFTQMSDLLAVPEEYDNIATLPDKIDINLIEPGIKQNVKKFPIGRDLDPVIGNYELVAPFGFSGNTSMVYEETIDGWYSDDMKDMQLDLIKLSAKLENNAPIGATLYFEPLGIDENGNTYKIEVDETNKSSIPAGPGAEGDLNITIKAKDGQSITNLDGMHIIASMDSGESTEPLGPDQTIVLKDFKVTVSGSYVTDFKDDDNDN